MNNFMKRTSIFALIAAGLTAPSAYAGEASANIGVTSNYLFRGVTQTADQTAVSGGLDYGFDSGVYVGTWLSNVDFGAGGQTEIDYYIGYSGEFSEFSYDIGYAYYHYPEAEDTFGSDFSFGEIYASVSYDFLTAGIFYVSNSKTDDTTGAEVYIKGDTYYYLSGSWDLENDWNAGFTLGRQTFSDDGIGGADLNYTNASIDIKKSTQEFGDLTFTISKSSNASDLGNDDNIIPTISWGKNF